MVTEYPGNAIPAPGFAGGNNTQDIEVLYSTQNYHQKGVTLEPGQGVLETGTLLARNDTTNRYERAEGGTGAKGILRKSVNTGTDTGPDAQVFLGNILYRGDVKLNVVKAANNNITDVALTGALGGRVDADAPNGGFFAF